MKKTDVVYNILENAEYFRRHFVNPETYIKKVYKHRMGKELELAKPITYNEKLQWIKLYDHNPLYTILVDKYKVKQYVAKQIGETYIIPTLGVWNSFDRIDFDNLPNQFVLKCTHDSGGLVICKDKQHFDKKTARKKINRAMQHNYYYMGFEWPYKNVKPQIIAESYMQDTKTGELRDYKFFCFNGKVKALFIATERQKEGTDVKFDFFDENFRHLSFKQGHENAEITPEKPMRFEEMKKIAEILSKGIMEVRVDLYEVNGRVYFGEMTFFHHGGWTPFEPENWDVTFGEWIDLSLTLEAASKLPYTGGKI